MIKDVQTYAVVAELDPTVWPAHAVDVQRVERLKGRIECASLLGVELLIIILDVHQSSQKN